MKQILCDALPQGAILLSQGRVMLWNQQMSLLLPLLAPQVQLEAGAPLPHPLAALFQEDATISVRNRQFILSRQSQGDDMLLLVEQETSGLDEKSVSDLLLRLRQDMSEAGLGLDGLMEAEDLVRIEKVAQLRRSYYGMLRSLEHMELLQGEHPQGERMQMELVGYCQRIQMESASLLRKVDATLEVVPKGYQLTVEGEEPLLQRLILGLIANAIQQGGRELVLQLSKSRGRCKIILWARGAASPDNPKIRVRRALLALPDSLDMPTARVLCKRLNASLLVSKTEEGRVRTTIALPLVEGSSLPLQSPNVTQGERYNQLMVEFADILPSRVFVMGNLE